MFDSQNSSFVPPARLKNESELTWDERLFPMQQLDHMNKEKWLARGFIFGIILFLVAWLFILNCDLLLERKEWRQLAMIVAL
mmetsp:Transcript_19242/g.29504  ORF Transcript_19242/g.29504 Transcript_19242/m.29504 type:complete len:82 (+) Transcript_19242:456-701(+)